MHFVHLVHKLRMDALDQVATGAYLLEAARGDHADECRRLLAAGADVNARNDHQNTPLHLAAAKGHIEACHVLTEAGASVQARDEQQATPLHHAARNGHEEVCRMLMEASAAIDDEDDKQFTPLHLAAVKGYIEVCRMLMEAGAAVEAGDDMQNTPLHIAAVNGHIEVCRMLMAAGAAVDARTNQQHTPLHLAAMFGRDETCVMLAFEGADLTARSSTNQIPADMAQDRGFAAPCAALAAHLRNSNGAHCLRCTGPSLEPRLLWNDTTQQQQDAMLDEMQAQWLARVAEGCAHARVGLTLRGAFNGGLSTRMLLHVMGYVFGGTQAHLQSCISTGRVTNVSRVLADDSRVVVQEQLLPRMALVSHAMALAATPALQPVSCSSTAVLSDEARRKLQVVLAQLDVAASGCEWLHAYCNFLQRRHQLGEEQTDYYYFYYE
jgi:ankyrin repeat protein